MAVPLGYLQPLTCDKPESIPKHLGYDDAPGRVNDNSHVINSAPTKVGRARTRNIPPTPP